MAPYKCPKCPVKHYYGTLVPLKADKVPACPNCKTTLVVVTRSRG